VVLSVVLSTLTVVGAIALLIAYGPRSANPGGGTTAKPGQNGHPPHVSVRSVELGGTFHPAEIVGADGALWLNGSTGVTGSGVGGDQSTVRCALERVDPARLSPVAHDLSACGINIVAGQGQLYLETETGQRGTNNVVLGIEAFSTSTHLSRILTPDVMTVVGSADAHTQLAYADGNLWLYGYTNHAEVVQVSPDSGAVVQTFTTGVPEIGGTEPLIAAGPGGVWLAGGAGGSSALARLSEFPTALEWVLTPEPAALLSPTPATTTVEWLATVAGRLWVGEATTASGGPHPALVERIVVLDSSVTGGRVEVQGSAVEKGSPADVVEGSVSVVKRSPAEDFGVAPVSVGKDVFSVGPGPSCGSQPVWWVNPSSLRTSVVSTLHPSVDPCLSEGTFRSVTSTGQAVFVLDGSAGTAPAMLYRIED